MKLFVAALPYDFDDVDLKEMFELYGEVNSAKVVLDKETGKSRGFGFVDMPVDSDARLAIETLDGAGIKGKKLSVKEAEEQSRGGSGGGGGFRRDSRPPSRDRDNRDNRDRGDRGRGDGRPPRRY